MNGRQQAKAFRKQYNLKIINSATLWEALTEQGFSIIEFNGVQDQDSVLELISALHLEDQISHSKCFTYQNDKYRLIFIHEDLNDEERTVVLAHEEGHIWNQHMHKDNAIGTDVIHEHEANEFAHYLLEDRYGKKRRTRIITAISIAAFILIAATGLFLKENHDKAVYMEDLYRTETGTKYHVRDCIYIKDRTDVYRLTQEEFDSGKYEPCSACRPDER